MRKRKRSSKIACRGDQSQLPNQSKKSKIRNLPAWRNWQTHTTQNRITPIFPLLKPIVFSNHRRERVPCGFMQIHPSPEVAHYLPTKTAFSAYQEMRVTSRRCHSFAHRTVPRSMQSRWIRLSDVLKGGREGRGRVRNTLIPTSPPQVPPCRRQARTPSESES